MGSRGQLSQSSDKLGLKTGQNCSGRWTDCGRTWTSGEESFPQRSDERQAGQGVFGFLHYKKGKTASDHYMQGSIFVWASGNGGRHIDDCNCDGNTVVILVTVILLMGTPLPMCANGHGQTA